MGPFLLAHLLRCPVHTLFCSREGGRYRVHWTPFAERLDWPRGQREAAITQCAQRYGLALEAQCRATPFEWFNFFDFWSDHRNL
jgi:predicted LPLAT superfamily acyltransferase